MSFNSGLVDLARPSMEPEPVPNNSPITTSRWIRTRMSVVAAFLMIIFGGVLYKGYNLQVIRTDEMTEMAMIQSSRDLTLQARRGGIFDRRGVALAISVEVPSVFAHPKLVQNPSSAAELLAPILSIDQSVLEKKLKAKRNYCWLSRRVTPEIAREVDRLKIKGIGLVAETRRYYPHQDLAGCTIGFVGIDDQGLSGLELEFEEKLKGDLFRAEGLRDVFGKTMVSVESETLTKLEGYSIYLTIDERIQRVVEYELESAVKASEAKQGVALVVDPWTGELLAVANYPRFDPNRYPDFRPSDWKDGALLDVYEPGSTFKAVVVAAALDRGVVNSNTWIDTEKGYLTIGRYKLHDHKRLPKMQVKDVIKYSSNIGAYKISKLVGRKTFYEYIRRFGFGSKTTILSRGESSGIVHRPQKWAEISQANIAFGNGISVSSLQMVMAYGAIANGGVLLKPQIVKSIRDKNGNVIESFEPQVRWRAIKPETAKSMTKLLQRVVQKKGTGTMAALEEFKVAGKTGTAQKVNPKTGAYDDQMWIGSFVGYVPADNPEVVILVVIDEPREVHVGGVVAAPAFANIASETLKIRGVLPADVHSGKLFAGQEKQSMVNPELVDKSKQVESNRVVVPNFSGLSAQEALQLAHVSNLQIFFDGCGVVRQQNPPVGELVNPWYPCRLTLSPRKLTHSGKVW